MVNPPLVQLVIDIEADTDPIRGVVHTGGHVDHAFSGWLQLAGLLETARVQGFHRVPEPQRLAR